MPSIQPKANWRKLWWIIPSSVIALLGLFAFWILWAPNTTSDASERVVTIPRGASFKTVSDSLETSGALRSRWAFNLAGRILGLTKEIKVGKYHFPSGLSNIEILHDLKEGKSRYLIPIAIPEGWRVRFIAHRFGRDLGIDEARFVSLCANESFIKSLGVEASSLEGYLMPDTYSFFWQTDEEEIVARLVKEFRKFYVDSLHARQEQLNMSLNDVLSLASIIEGESHLDSERPTIAGVYLNRLKKKMRLEADPTIQYAIPDGPRRLLYSDLKIDSPYNTYVHYGLPPGPISNPGRQSILAVLYPEKHQYLYFVANGNGGHKFSKNYSEHQRAVRNYRKMRREAQKAANATG